MLIVTNGDQTDTIHDYLKKGFTFEAAASHPAALSRTPPTIPPASADWSCGEKGKLSYRLSILKSDEGDPTAPQRFFFEYVGVKPGVGHFLHTYSCDGNPIPSFGGEPEKVTLRGDIDSFTQAVWDNLNPDNKVSLFVRFIDLGSGESETRIVNKNV